MELQSPNVFGTMRCLLKGVSSASVVPIDETACEMFMNGVYDNIRLFFKTEIANRKTMNDQLFKQSIGNNIFLVAKYINNELFIHIRLFEVNNGKLYPTMYGISMDNEMWLTFQSRLQEIDDRLIVNKNCNHSDMNTRIHMGDNFYASLTSDFSTIHIRKWFIPRNERNFQPSRQGITLTYGQWLNLKSARDSLYSWMFNSIQEN